MRAFCGDGMSDRRQDRVSDGGQHGGHRAGVNEDGMSEGGQLDGNKEGGQCCFLSQLSVSLIK